MRSTRYAAALALGYTILAAVYIVVSSNIAARLSADVEQMRHIETFKGVLYVLVTANAIFFGARYAFGLLERRERAIATRDRALLANERRVFAGLMAGSIAHDANNVLVAVIADLDELRRPGWPDDPAMRRLQLSVERLVALNRRLLTAARRGGVTQPEDVDLVPAIRDTLAVARGHAQLREASVRFEPQAGLVLHTHVLLVQQVVANLLVNAGEATQGRGRVEVRLQPGPDGAVIEVHDDGPGVPAERRGRLFDALETTKAGGSGLGLFSVKTCVDALQGAVEVDDSPLGGACFRVRVPSLDRRRPAPAETTAGAPAEPARPA